MTIVLKNKNFAYSTLSAQLLSGGSSCSVATGDGAKFDFPSRAVLWGRSFASPLLDSTREIVQITNISTDTLTITRAQESTSAKQWESGDKIALVATAGKFVEIENEVNYIENSYVKKLGVL